MVGRRALISREHTGDKAGRHTERLVAGTVMVIRHVKAAGVGLVATGRRIGAMGLVRLGSGCWKGQGYGGGWCEEETQTHTEHTQYTTMRIVIHQ